MKTNRGKQMSNQLPNAVLCCAAAVGTTRKNGFYLVTTTKADSDSTDHKCSDDHIFDLEFFFRLQVENKIVFFPRTRKDS